MRLNNLCLATLLAFPLMAVGQNIYSGNGANADWSTAANWQNGIPVSGVNTSLVFSTNTNGGTPNQNLATPFTLNRIDFNSSLPAITLSGAPLALSNNTSSTPPALVQLGTAGVTVANQLVLSGDLSTDVIQAIGSLTLSGGFSASGGGGLSKGGAGSLTLTNGGALHFLYHDTGSLQIAAGAYTLTGTGDAGSFRLQASAVVTGGATLSTPILNVGNSGTQGALAITGGATVNATLVDTSRNATASGNLMLSGTGSTLISTNVAVGGAATSSTAGGAATVTIDSGATLQTNALTVYGQGLVTLKAGGTLKVSQFTINPPSAGAVNGLDWQGGTLRFTSSTAVIQNGVDHRELTIPAGRLLAADGQLTIQSYSEVSFNGGTADLHHVVLGSGGGTPGYLSVARDSIAVDSLNIAFGSLHLGESSKLTVGGTITVAQTGTVVLDSELAPPLAANKIILQGGSISGTQALNLSQIGTLQGSGTVSCSVLGSGSIAAQGSLIMGNMGSTTGFNYNGSLTIDPGATTILLDADLARLGTATSLGEGSSLITINGAQLFGGRTLTASASASISGSFVNIGAVAGPAQAGSWLTFEDSVTGNGTFSGNIRMRGEFSPGILTAKTTCSGNLELESSNVLTMDITSDVRGGGYDALDGTGLLTVGGTLLIKTDNYAPPLGTTFDLFDWPTITGSFSTLSLPALGSGMSWDTSNLYTTGQLVVVPEPTGGVGLLIALGLLACRRRKSGI